MTHPFDDDPDYDEDWDPADDCDHLEATIDTLEGRAVCHCGHSWWLSDEELRAELKFQAEAAEAYAAEYENESAGNKR